MRPSAPALVLSPARRRLVEVFQRVHFGRLEHLLVRNGEPVLHPPPRFVRDVKLGGDNTPRPDGWSADEPAKPHLREFFDELTAVGNGVIEVVEIKHGLPFLMRIVGAVE